jgi:hypothetical protein
LKFIWQTGLRPSWRQNCSSSDNRTGKRTAPGFVHARDARHFFPPQRAFEFEAVILCCASHYFLNIEMVRGAGFEPAKGTRFISKDNR